MEKIKLKTIFSVAAFVYSTACYHTVMYSTIIQYNILIFMLANLHENLLQLLEEHFYRRNTLSNQQLYVMSMYTDFKHSYINDHYPK